MDRPTTGEVEQRSTPEVEVEGRRLRGVIPFGVESRDLGGWREVMEPGCLTDAQMADLVATVDHGGLPLGRYPGTLQVEQRDDGLYWAVALPESRADVREAVERGDLHQSSWRMTVGRDRWDGDVRHVEEVRELRDVAVVTTSAYPADATRAELRNRPETENPNPPERQEEPMEEETREGGGLAVEDRAATPENEPDVEQRIMDAIRSVRKGESRDLTTATADAITPPEMATYLWDRLRPASIGLASGITIIPTSREKVVWPRLTADVDPGWYAETEAIVEGDPAFGTLEATPKKLAHRVELSNEVIDDSEPSVIDVLNAHLTTMLALKLDRGIFESNPATDTDAIRGLKYVAGIQEISMGTNGAAVADYDEIIRAVGLLRSAGVAGPYAAAANPRTLTELELLKEDGASNNQITRPDGVPPIYVSSQLSVTEAKGTANNASSIYVYAPREVVLVRRMDAVVELDRSRLFDRDMSEVRAKLRADLIVPNPVAVVRVTGVVPPA